MDTDGYYSISQKGREILRISNDFKPALDASKVYVVKGLRKKVIIEKGPELGKPKKPGID